MTTRFIASPVLPLEAPAPEAPVAPGGSVVAIEGSRYHYTLRVNGKPTIVRGMGYNPWYADLPTDQRQQRYRQLRLGENRGHSAAGQRTDHELCTVLDCLLVAADRPGGTAVAVVHTHRWTWCAVPSGIDVGSEKPFRD